MYDTTDLINITLEDILLKTTEYNIYQHYLGDIKVAKLIKSPIRNNDKDPSFGIFISRSTGSLLWKDLGTGDTGNVIKLVKILFNLKSYKSALNQIYFDLSLNNKKRSVSVVSNISTKITSEAKIKVKYRSFSKTDYQYWKQYLISKETLDLFDVNPINYFCINDAKIKEYTDSEPMYCYDIYRRRKIYRPFSRKTEKWFGDLTIYDIQGYKQLPANGNLLIITKSLKDVMTLYELGYSSIAPPSETSNIPTVVINELKSRFTKIVSLYDRDLAGMKGARKLFKTYEIDFIFIPKMYETKDISDFAAKYGKTKTVALTKKLLK